MGAGKSKNNARRKSSEDRIGPNYPSDPIARNDKDIDKPEDVIQATKVSPSRNVAQNCTNLDKVIDRIQETEVGYDRGAPAQVASTMLLPDSPWGMNRPMQPAASATELLASILRFKWTLLAVFILVSAPIIAAVWTQFIPQYQARAEVRVQPIMPMLVFRTEDSGPIPFYDSFLNTQVSLIRGLTVLQRVLDQQDVQQTQWYSNPARSRLQRLRGNIAPALERLRENLSVQPRPRTEIIDISFIDPSAKDAGIIINAVLDQYIRYIREKSDATEDELYRQLVDQYKSLENEILGREKVSEELHKSLGTETPQELISGKRIRLDEIQARLNGLRNSIAMLEWQMKQITAADSNETPAATAVEKQSKYFEDAEWRKMDLDVRTIQHQIANSVYGPNHPERVRVEKDIMFAEELLRRRESQLDEQWSDRLKNASVIAVTIDDVNNPGYHNESMPVEYQLARAKREEQLLQAELEKQQAEFKGLFESAQLLEREGNALRHKRELFDAVRQRLDQKNIERNVPGSIEVLMRAFVPSRPYNDRRIVFTAMVLILGLGVGCGAAFLRASRDQTIYAPKDMPQPMQVPFIGLIPLIHNKKSPGKSLVDEIGQNRFMLTESIRVLRTALLSRLGSHGNTTVLITSAMAGTGKSSFTKILGESLAQAGRKVLMIDADFQNMSLSKRFDQLDKPGFMDCLSSGSLNGQYIFPTEISTLSIMPAGTRGDNSVAFEQIANGAFKTCIDQLYKQYNYDIILLDSSPILPVADAAILASQVDGTIMVEREHLSRRANVASALARLGNSGGRLLGTVFVGSADREDYGYKYGYHYYYSGSGNRKSE